jgi:hypothetical protein
MRQLPARVLVLAVRGDPPANCQAKVIRSALWRERGALALRRNGADFVIDSARMKNFYRPWAPNWVAARAERESIAQSSPANSDADRMKLRGAPRDATPSDADLEADQ